MKVGIVFALWLLSAAIGNARPQDLCPNFSGRFVIDSADRQIYITINQVGCDRIQISREVDTGGRVTKEAHDLTINGKFQPDIPWQGSSEAIQVSVRFTSAALEIVARPAASTNPTEFSWKALYVLRSNGDVEIRAFNRNTGFYEPVAIAVREQ